MPEATTTTAGTLAFGALLSLGLTSEPAVPMAATATTQSSYHSTLDLEDVEAMTLLDDPAVKSGLADLEAGRLVSFEDVFGEQL